MQSHSCLGNSHVLGWAHLAVNGLDLNCAIGRQTNKARRDTAEPLALVINKAFAKLQREHLKRLCDSLRTRVEAVIIINSEYIYICNKKVCFLKATKTIIGIYVYKASNAKGFEQIIRNILARAEEQKPEVQCGAAVFLALPRLKRVHDFSIPQKSRF